MAHVDDLITTDSARALDFAGALARLEDNATGQLELWPVEDVLAPKRYVACPRRRTHLVLTECWMCWCDVTFGRAAVAEELAPPAAGELA